MAGCALRCTAGLALRAPAQEMMGKGKREMASGVAFSVLMAAHYAVFFVVDARHLLHQFRRWRASSAQVRILDKTEQESSDP